MKRKVIITGFGVALLFIIIPTRNEKYKHYSCPGCPVRYLNIEEVNRYYLGIPFNWRTHKNIDDNFLIGASSDKKAFTKLNYLAIDALAGLTIGTTVSYLGFRLADRNKK